MTIDVLAQRAGMTARSIRAYRTRGLLPAPRLVRRVGWYDGGHLARLREIGLLLRRGYPLAVIGELLSAFEDGRVNAARKLTPFRRLKTDPPAESHRHAALSLGTLPSSLPLSL
ncbi:MAG: MerR family transcriptional regulator [Actinomycetota bacterium]